MFCHGTVSTQMRPKSVFGRSLALIGGGHLHWTHQYCGWSVCAAAPRTPLGPFGGQSPIWCGWRTPSSRPKSGLDPIACEIPVQQYATEITCVPRRGGDCCCMPRSLLFAPQAASVPTHDHITLLFEWSYAFVKDLLIRAGYRVIAILGSSVP